jgi:hypothetical protein
MTYLQNNAALVQQASDRADGEIKRARNTANSATVQVATLNRQISLCKD